MNIRDGSVLFILACLVLSLALPVWADTSQAAVFGANSAREGSTTQVNNGGSLSYVKITNVAPIVNRIRIVNLANGSIVFDGCPVAGTTLYMPKGSYMITGWSAYGTEDRNAVVAVFTQAPDPVASPQEPKPAPQPTMVDGNAAPANQNMAPAYYNNGGLYYPYPNYGMPYGSPYVYPGLPPVPQSRYIWCTYCGKYHVPGGCAFTLPQKSVLDPYNPYWRGK